MLTRKKALGWGLRWQRNLLSCMEAESGWRANSARAPYLRSRCPRDERLTSGSMTGNTTLYSQRRSGYEKFARENRRGPYLSRPEARRRSQTPRQNGGVLFQCWSYHILARRHERRVILNRIGVGPSCGKKRDRKTGSCCRTRTTGLVWPKGSAYWAAPFRNRDYGQRNCAM